MAPGTPGGPCATRIVRRSSRQPNPARCAAPGSPPNRHRRGGRGRRLETAGRPGQARRRGPYLHAGSHARRASRCIRRARLSHPAGKADGAGRGGVPADRGGGGESRGHARRWPRDALHAVHGRGKQEGTRRAEIHDHRAERRSCGCTWTAAALHPAPERRDTRHDSHHRTQADTCSIKQSGRKITRLTGGHRRAEPQPKPGCSTGLGAAERARSLQASGDERVHREQDDQRRPAAGLRGAGGRTVTEGQAGPGQIPRS